MKSALVNINQKLSLFSDHWHPRIVGELNGQHVKLAKLLGEFVWHHSRQPKKELLNMARPLDMAKFYFPCFLKAIYRNGQPFFVDLI